ncbi:MAG: ATP-dependent helicase [Chloroflexi bacterium]|nr:ATP-dependent helicase [Chloroflexota bacterium]
MTRSTPGRGAASPGGAPAGRATPSTGAARAARSGRRRRGEPPDLEQIPVWLEHAAAPGAPEGLAVPAGVDTLLAGLNAEQRRAVTHGEGPLLVVAGAGTGKTQVVTRRIAWLIATKRAAPSEILALTFTDKAAEEMQVRVDQLVPYGYTDTVISTFHAFGDRVIREHALELGLPAEPRVLSRPETVIFLQERLFRLDLDEYRPLGNPTRFLDALAALFSRLKDEDVSPAAYAAHAARLAAEAEAVTRDLPAREALLETARKQAELAAAYSRYQELLGEAGAIDFGDQVALALRLLREHPAARAELQARFRYILVDEFQDVNRAQAELVALLAEPRRNVAVVGDDDQSIYRFRGAATGAIVDFLDRFRGARTIVLRRNYRSRPPILDASYRLIRFNDPDRLEVHQGITKRLIAQRRAGAAAGARSAPPPVRQVAFGTGSEEADWVAAEIGTRLAGGAAPRDFAVLVRANADADPVLRSLNLAGVPWRFSGASGLYGRPEIRVLLSFLRAVGEPASSVDVYGLAASDVYGMGGDDLAALASRARRTNRSLWETLVEVDSQPGLLRLRPEARTSLARLVADLHRFIELGHRRPAGEVLYDFLRSSGSLARLMEVGTAAADEALSNIARFFEIVRAQSDLLADDRAVFLAPHLQTLIEAGDDPATADLDPDANAVAVVTVHKAKGLEWPVVFLVGLVDGRFPARGRREQLAVPDALLRGVFPTGDAHVQEERRLFYVGMTRARDELVLTHALDYGGKRTRRASPFVLEALDLPAGATPPTRATSPAERLAAFEAPPVEAPVARPADGEAAGGLVEPLVLSFYLVDDYLTCPLKYKYVHVMRVPIAPHHAIVYGSALHQAVQEFHRRHGRGEVMTEEALIAAFEAAWRNEGFVSREHEEARLDAGRRALRRFREEQLLPGAVIPAYVEREFTFTLDGDRVRGRMDRVDVIPLAAGAGNPAIGVAGAPPLDPTGRGVVDGEIQPGAGIRGADVVEPTLALLAERVVITDYKSSDVRDPSRARERARESLQLTIYAMAWQAQTGRLPNAVALHFLESGLVGMANVDDERVEKGVADIRAAAAGIRAHRFEATPSYMACSWCAFREVCPASVAR